MPTLIRFVIFHFANGFLIGALVTLGILAFAPMSALAMLLDDSPVGILLALYATGSAFGLGSLATALLFEPERY